MYINVYAWRTSSFLLTGRSVQMLCLIESATQTADSQLGAILHSPQAGKDVRECLRVHTLDVWDSTSSGVDAKGSLSPDRVIVAIMADSMGPSAQVQVLLGWIETTERFQ